MESVREIMRGYKTEMNARLHDDEKNKNENSRE